MYNYGLIGDMASAALVGTDGAVDWCCFPRFDSPSVFAAILDQEDGGRFRIGPVDPGFDTSQEYLPDTNILETTFTTAAGIVAITDFMPVSDHDDDPATPFEASHEIHRIVTCIPAVLRCAATSIPYTTTRARCLSFGSCAKEPSRPGVVDRP